MFPSRTYQRGSICQAFRMLYTSGLLFLPTILSYPQSTAATVICQQCYPLTLQEAPGIGISLTFEHATAAIKFCNGTTVDAAYIIGSENYTRAMAYFLEITKSNDLRVSEIWVTNAPHTYLAQANIFQSLMEWVRSLFAASKTASSDSQISAKMMPLVPIATMLDSISQQLTTMYNLTDRFVGMSLPDPFDEHNRKTISVSSSILELVSLPGDVKLSSSRLRAAMTYFYSLYNCSDGDDDDHSFDPPDCDKYEGRKVDHVLGIELGERNFYMQDFRRDDGFFEPGLHSAHFSLDSGTAYTPSLTDEKNPTCWKRLQTTVQQYVVNIGNDIDLLVLHGTQVTHPSFQKLLEEVFRTNPNITATDYLRSFDDHVYAAARFSAGVAKAHGWLGSNGCMMNNRCPMSDHMPDTFSWRDNKGRKDEL